MPLFFSEIREELHQHFKAKGKEYTIPPALDRVKLTEETYERYEHDDGEFEQDNSVDFMDIVRTMFTTTRK